jgi:hypothetical protein
LKILEDIWILLESGVVLVKRITDKNIKTQLFGGLMSALNSFADQLSDGGLSSFEISQKKFVLMKQNKIIFVTTVAKNIKEKRVIEQLSKVSEKFFELYPLEWLQKEWDSDISYFSDFKKEIDSIS